MFFSLYFSFIGTLNTVTMDSSNTDVPVMFTCFLCGQKMHDKSGYREHMKFCVFINDDGIRFFPCFLCGGESQGKPEYKKHLKMCLFEDDSNARNNLGEQKVYTMSLPCGFCRKRLKSVVEAHEHVDNGHCTIDKHLKIELKDEEEENVEFIEVCESADNLDDSNNLNMVKIEAASKVSHQLQSNPRANFEVMDTVSDTKSANDTSFDSFNVPVIPKETIASIESLPNIIAKSFTCDYCGKSFSLKKRLIKHMASEHASDLSDREPSSTVSIHTPNDDQQPVAPAAVASEMVWRGCLFMSEVAKFEVTAHSASGYSTDIMDELPYSREVVGLISPDTVWDYIGGMRKKANQVDILVVKLQAINDEEFIPYIALYSYLSSRNRLGVLGSVSSKIKDFYIMPFPQGSRLPPVLLPLEPPACLGDQSHHLLLGIIVVHSRKRPAPTSLIGPANKLSRRESALERTINSPIPQQSEDAEMVKEPSGHVLKSGKVGSECTTSKFQATEAPRSLERAKKTFSTRHSTVNSDTDFDHSVISPKNSDSKLKPKRRLKQNVTSAHKCNTCSKIFGFKSHLLGHKTAVHQKVKNFKRDTCGKEYGLKSNLNSLVAVVHDKGKNFRCTICGKTFGRKGDLNKHIVVVHNKEKNFKRDICGNEFGQKGTLNKHIAVLHEKMKSFVCHICHRAFGWKGNLLRHITGVH